MTLREDQRAVLEELRCPNGCDPSFLLFVYRNSVPVVKVDPVLGTTQALIRCANCDTWQARTLSRLQRQVLDDAKEAGRLEMIDMRTAIDQRRIDNKAKFLMFLLNGEREPW